MGAGSLAVGKIKQVGNDYFKEGDYIKASKAYSKALKYDPSNGLILSNRSACYHKLSKYKSALDDALSCISLLPNWHKSYYRLSVVLKSLNLISESLINAQISLSIQSDPIVKSLLDELQSLNPAPCRNNLLIWGNSHIRPTIVKELSGIPIVELTCGISHIAALSLNSFVFIWGDNSHGQCGMDGSCEFPRLIPALLGQNIIAIVAGGGHTIALTKDGDIYAWGINKLGQCGTKTEMKYPTQVQVPGKIKGASAGLMHTFLLLTDNSLCVSGGNSNGQLGTGSTSPLFSFTKLPIIGNFISCGAVHTLIVTPSGDLLSTGGNSCGQLGVGDFEDRLIPTKVETLNDISVCRCGEEFSVAITSTSKIFTFGKSYLGLGNVGQLGCNISQSSVPVEVVSMGKNLGSENVACTKSTVMVVTRNLETYIWGLVPDYSNLSNKSVLPEKLQTLKLKKVKDIQCMRDTFFIMTEYVLNNSYVVGLPLSPVEAGKKHTARVNLLDSRCLFVLDPVDKIGVICFDSAGKLSNGEVLTYWDNSTHLIELKLFHAGYHYLYVFVNGTLLKTSPYVYTVGHSGFNCALGFISDDRVLINAGNKFVMLIKIFDKFENLIVKDLNLVIKPSIGTCGILDFHEGCYRVQIIINEIGRHSFKIQCNGTDILFAIEDYSDPKNVKIVKKVQSIDVHVLPGLVDKKKCTVEGLKDEYFVAENVDFKVISRDEFGNTTWHRNKQWDMQVPFSYEISESLDSCYTTVNGKSYKVGKVILKIGYEGWEFFNKEINFLPGKMFLQHTRLLGEGQKNCFFTEKCSKEFEIQFFDEYFNPCATTIALKSNAEYNLSQIQENSYKVNYKLNNPGIIRFSIETNSGTLEVNIKVEKDPALVQQEQREQELEKKRQEQLKAEKARFLNEEKLRVEEELRRRAELKMKEKELQESLSKQTQIEEAELKRRQKIVEKLKMQELTKKRAEEALKKLEEEKQVKPPKQWKRTGGGFVVPFIIEDL